MLIDKTDIAQHREISRSVKDDKINPYIEDAELLDLKPLLGELLYNDIVDNSGDAIYVDLLEPKTYTYDGKNYKHSGLKKVLSIFANARYVIHGSYTDTGFGLVQKSNQDSQPVSETQKRNIYKKEQQTATAYFGAIALFLDRNKTVYPLWKVNCQSGNRRIRFNKITI